MRKHPNFRADVPLPAENMQRGDWHDQLTLAGIKVRTQRTDCGLRVTDLRLPYRVMLAE
jgi:hypothetical protein